MEVVEVSVDMLLADPRNSRLHDETNLAAIEASFKKFQQQKPIVVGKDNVIIAGNGSLVVAARLGWPTIKVVYSDLTGDDATAFGIADNRTAELASWDYAQLAASVTALEASGYDLGATGWSEEELNNIVGGVDWQPPDLTEGGLDGFGGNTTDDGDVTLTFNAAQWEAIVKKTGKTTGLEVVAALMELVTKP